MILKFVVDRHIRIPRVAENKQGIRELKRKLTFDNPEYTNRVMMGKSTWNVEEKIEAFSVSENELIIPRGCAGIVKEKNKYETMAAGTIEYNPDFPFRHLD